jgi:hypothetical protein
MKRIIISIALIFALSVSPICTIFAAASTNSEVNGIFDPEVIISPNGSSATALAQLENIPIYVTVLDVSDFNERQALQTEISNELKQKIESNYDVTGQSKLNKKTSKESAEDYIRINGEKFRLAEVTVIERTALFNNPVFFSTFSRASQLIESDVRVKNINFYINGIPEPEISGVRSGGIDDPSYWEGICNPLESYGGLYNGHKFLYLESSISIETPEVVPGNITSSFNWGTFLSKSAQSFVNMYIGTVSTFVSVAKETISNILGSITTPLSVTYGAASGGYIKTRVVGQLYMRTVLIRDDDDRVPGYAYYSWATTEQTRLQQSVASFAPVSRRTPTTYNYEYESDSSSVKTKSSSGFYGGASFYASVISLYNNYMGYFTHNEILDISSLTSSIIAN